MGVTLAGFPKGFLQFSLYPHCFFNIAFFGDPDEPVQLALGFYVFLTKMPQIRSNMNTLANRQAFTLSAVCWLFITAQLALIDSCGCDLPGCCSLTLDSVIGHVIL